MLSISLPEKESSSFPTSEDVGRSTGTASPYLSEEGLENLSFPLKSSPGTKRKTLLASRDLDSDELLAPEKV